MLIKMQHFFETEWATASGGQDVVFPGSLREDGQPGKNLAGRVLVHTNGFGLAS